jgi:hypothetical protein
MYNLTIPASERGKRTTLHGLVRVMQRAGKNEQQSMRMISNAWQRGKAITEMTHAKQRRWMEHHNSISLDGETILHVYCNYLFIFNSSGILITMLSLPRTFFKKKHYDADNRPVRNARQFARMNGAMLAFE